MLRKLSMAASIISLALSVMSQERFDTDLMVSLTTEGQYNMTKGKINWVNLLEVGRETCIGKSITLMGDFISVQNAHAQKKEGGICEDLQTFSNIEDENQTLGLFAFGPTWRMNRNFRFFFGVRNVNLDYFTSPMTSVFTGSSQGIYPTLSSNWDWLANYPLSAMCLHLEWRFSGNWEIKNSFYNGVAYYDLTDVFRFRPERDGIFTITQLGYTGSEDGNCWLGDYYVGFAYGNTPDEEGRKNKQTSIYGLIEQPFSETGLGLLLEGGWAPKSLSLCQSYFGVGIVCADLYKENANLGVMINRALYKEGRETDIEITYSIAVTKHITVQPCMHFIRTNGKSNEIGMVRVNFIYNNR